MGTTDVSLRLRICMGVALVTIVGVITAPAMNLMRRSFARQVEGESLHVVVADLRGAAIAMTAAELTDSLMEHPFSRSLPAALVVADANETLIREHAWGAAQRGVLRVAYLDLEPALQWAFRESSLVRRTAPFAPERFAEALDRIAKQTPRRLALLQGPPSEDLLRGGSRGA